MKHPFSRLSRVRFLFLLAFLSLGTACSDKQGKSSATADDPELHSRGTIEVTARLLEVPEGAIFKRDLYDYATVLPYEVVTVYRGSLTVGQKIYIAHYDPFKPRSQAADRRVKEIGGNLTQFRAGDLHHMALGEYVDDFFMGGLVNKYFAQTNEKIFWAIWTDKANP